MEANRLDFGDYVLIEQKRHGVPNEFYRYKVIRQLESSVYTDVPVQVGAERSVAKTLVPVVACICCGVDETRVQNFRVEDVKYLGNQQQSSYERLNRAYEVLRWGLNAIAKYSKDPADTLRARGSLEDAYRIKEGDGEQG